MTDDLGELVPDPDVPAEEPTDEGDADSPKNDPVPTDAPENDPEIEGDTTHEGDAVK